MEEDPQTKFWRRFGELYLEHVKTILERSGALITPNIFSVLAQHLRAVSEGYEYITSTESVYNDIDRLNSKMHSLKLFAKGLGYTDDIKLIHPIYFSEKYGYSIAESYYVYARPIYSQEGVASATIIGTSGLEEKVRETATKLLQQPAI